MQEKFYIASTKFSLQERQTKKGKVYDVVFRIITKDGEEKQKKLSGYASKTLAKAAHLDFIQEYCELLPRNPIKRHNPKKQELTFDELTREYFAVLAGSNKPSTVYGKQLDFDNYFTPRFANKRIKEITAEVLYQLQDDLLNTISPKTKKMYSKTTVRKMMSYLGAFLEWCHTRYGYPNHMPEVKRPPKEDSLVEMKFWTREEFEKFIAVVDDPMYHCIFTVLFFTGRRKGEILALQPKDIRGDKIRYSKSVSKVANEGEAFTITSTKAKKVAILPISKTVQDELAAYTMQKPFVFGGERPVPFTTLDRAFKKYIDISGIEEIRIHDLRHSFVSLCVHLGANMKVIAELISDTVEQVMKTYAHMYESDRQNIVDAIG